MNQTSSEQAKQIIKVNGIDVAYRFMALKTAMSF